MGEVTVRRASAEEVPLAGELTYQAYLDGGFTTADDPYAAHLADAAPRFGGAELLVAVDADGSVLGTVTVAPPGSSMINLAGPDELEFRMLAVSPAARGRGVGEALVRAVLDRAGELGLPAVVLSSQPDMAAAHRLYRRFGFRRTPDRDWSPVPGETLVTFRLER